MPSLIEVRGLSKWFRSGDDRLLVLADVDLAIDAGSYVAILGPSGSGKSTLLGLLAGLDRPSAGDVVMDGLAFGTATEDALALMRRQSLGFVFQSFQLLDGLTALENVCLPIELARRGDADRRGRELLSEVGLGHRLDHYPRQLSGGEQQRVAIARAFASAPRLLLADEPTGNLDQESGRRILDLMDELRRREGTALVLVTHDADVAGRAERVIRLRDGRVESDVRR